MVGGHISSDENEFNKEEEKDKGYESGDEDGGEDDDSGDDVDSAMITMKLNSQLVKDNRAFPGGTCIYPIFNRFLLPSLQILNIAARHSAVDNDLIPALIELHVCSGFQLTSLHICNIRFEVDDLHRLFLNLVTLEQLCIQSPNFAESLPDLMENLEYLPAKATANVHQNLETLAILDHFLPRDQEATDDISLRILESRS